MPIDLPSAIIGILIAVIARCLWDEYWDHREGKIREQNRKEINQELERINQNLVTLHQALQIDYDEVAQSAIADLVEDCRKWQKPINQVNDVENS